MAIIVEDGTGTNPLANSYVSEAELTTYATDRGITLTGTAAVLLINAMDWIESQTYAGSKTSDTQPLQWPREGVYIDGVLVANDTIPKTLKDLQMRVAVDTDAGSDYSGVSSQAVKQETVFGAVSVTYQEGSAAGTISKNALALLAKLTQGAGFGGNQFQVSRG